MNNINRNLERYQQQIIRKQKLDNMVKTMLKKKQELEYTMNDLSTILFKNGQMKNKLAGLRLSSLYYNIAGRDMEQVGIETRKNYVAMLKYDLMRAELVNLDRDIKRSYNELSCLRGCEKRYLDAIVKKTKYLESIKFEYSEEYLESENKKFYLSGQKREMRCEMEVAKIALRAISSVKTGLDSVKSWGTIDRIKANNEAFYKKKQYVDNTQNSLYRMQIVLQKLLAEINDVNISEEDQAAIAVFTNFAYYFITGLFMDTDLYGHILTTRERLNKIYEKINDVVNVLRTKCEVIDEEINKLSIKNKELCSYMEIA